MQPKVSVVIAFLNGANFIGEAIASVFAQTLSDWELVLVDDGSTDSSSRTAREIADAYERVSYLTHPGGVNRGVAESRVLGSSAARGEYLLFLDHDDILYPHALERLVAILDANPGAAAVFGGLLFWAFDPSLGVADSHFTYGKLGTGVVPGRRVLRDLIRSDDHHPAPCSMLYRRSAYVIARDASETFPGMYEETAVMFKLLTRGDVYLLDEPVAAYRLHATSMCHRAKAAGRLSDHGYSPDRMRFLKWAAANVPMDLLSRAQLAVALASLRLQRRLYG